jgi:hypothetical protein
MVELNEGWAYVRTPQGLAIFSPEEWREALGRGRLQKVADIIRREGRVTDRALVAGTRYPDLRELCQLLTRMGKIRPAPGRRGGGGWCWAGRLTDSGISTDNTAEAEEKRR